MVIIDGHVHISDAADPSIQEFIRLGLVRPFSAEALIHHMDHPTLGIRSGEKVERALVMPFPVVTNVPSWDFRKQHQYIARVVKKYPSRLMGCMMINPLQGVEEACTVLRDLVRNHGFRAVKLHPKAHNYRPDNPTMTKELLVPIVEAARKLKVPVLIHTGDPLCEPSRIVPLIEACSDATIILCHLGIQNVTYSSDAVHVARKNDNVILETGWAPGARLKEAVNALGPERLVFASDCPVNDMWSWITTVRSLALKAPLGIGLSMESIDKILGGNFAKLVRLRSGGQR